MQQKQILKNATGVDTKLAKKVGLANLKFDVDQLDIDKRKNVTANLSNTNSNVHKLTVLDDLSKVRDAVKIDVAK